VIQEATPHLWHGAVLQPVLQEPLVYLKSKAYLEVGGRQAFNTAFISKTLITVFENEKLQVGEKTSLENYP